MRIHNIRLGFATNSSSTHSLIFLYNEKDEGVEDLEFGWDHFVAASDSTKRAYIASVIGVALEEHVDKETAAIVTQQLVGKRCGTKSWNWSKEGYIDHQSVYALPYNWHGNGLDYEFVKEFSEFMLNRNLVILGGNDNDGEKHPLDNGTAFVLNIDIDGVSKNWIAKKDPQGFWTLFNKNTGGKLRMTFPKNLKDVEKRWSGQITAGVLHPEYSTTPDLIDIKITDYCERGCSFCYQGSSEKGEHADLSSGNIWALSNALSRLKVFEVAIGGGEPTQHPNFIEFLEDLKRSGITPNFSTRNLSWLKDDKKRERILDSIGTFAYSTECPRDVDELAAYLKVYCGNRIRRPVIHYVMGVAYYNFTRMLETAYHHGMDIVLLDYKQTGRGRHRSKGDYSDWIDRIVELRERNRCPNISIDTPLANNFETELAAEGVKDIFVHKEEGAFSMYMDLVDGKMGASSFSEEMIPLDITTSSDLLYEQIRTAFRTF